MSGVEYFGIIPTVAVVLILSIIISKLAGWIFTLGPRSRNKK